MNKFIPPLFLLLAASCAQVVSSPEGAVEDLPGIDAEVMLVPSVIITNVTDLEANFKVHNGTSVPFYYEGWSDRSPLAISEVQTQAGWRTSYVAFCGTGSGLRTLNPGQEVTGFVFNRNEGPMRIVMAFEDPEDEEVIQVTSEPHPD